MLKNMRKGAIGLFLLSLLLVIGYFYLMQTQDGGWGNDISQCRDTYGIYADRCERMYDEYWVWRESVDPMLFGGGALFIISLITMFVLSLIIPKNTSPVSVPASYSTTQAVDGVQPVMAPQKSNVTNNIQDELQKLADMKSKGLIDDEEYKSLKQRLIEGL